MKNGQNTVDTFSNKNLMEFAEEVLKNHSDKTIEIEIPLFQRDLSWNDEQKKSFRGCYENEEAFLGTIVLQQQDDSKFIVIDGQQRLNAILEVKNSNTANSSASKKGQILLTREFFSWKSKMEGNNHPGGLENQKGFIQREIEALPKNAKFNWIVYKAEVNAEDLFERINVDHKKLSTFDFFKASYYDAVSKKETSEKDSEFWKNFKDAVAERMSSLRKPDKEQPKSSDWLDRIYSADTFSFDQEEYEWKLRQLLAIAYFIWDEKKVAQHNYYSQTKRDCQDGDKLKEAITNFKDQNDWDEFLKILTTLIQGIKKEDLFLTRQELDGTTKNGFLFYFQAFSMALSSSWLASKQCAFLFKNYFNYREKLKKDETNKTKIEDREQKGPDPELEICRMTIKDLYAIDSPCLKALKSLKDLKVQNYSDNLKIISSTEPSREDLWLADWLLLCALKENNAALFNKTWEESVRSENSGDLFKPTTEPIFRKLQNNYSLPETPNSPETPKPIPFYAGDIEHWLAKNYPIKEEEKKGVEALLNCYGNLCLIPASENESLGDKDVGAKAIWLRSSPNKHRFLPKLMFNAEVVAHLQERFSHDSFSNERLLTFLTFFWAHFISQSLWD